MRPDHPSFRAPDLLQPAHESCLRLIRATCRRVIDGHGTANGIDNYVLIDSQRLGRIAIAGVPLDLDRTAPGNPRESRRQRIVRRAFTAVAPPAALKSTHTIGSGPLPPFVPSFWRPSLVAAMPPKPSLTSLPAIGYLQSKSPEAGSHVWTKQFEDATAGQDVCDAIAV